MRFLNRTQRALAELAAVLAVAVPLTAGCNDQTDSGAGTGGPGAGSAATSPEVNAPIGGATAKTANGATTARGEGSASSATSNPSGTADQRTP